MKILQYSIYFFKQIKDNNNRRCKLGPNKDVIKKNTLWIQKFKEIN